MTLSGRSDSVLHTLQTVIRTDCQPETLVCLGPIQPSLLPLFIPTERNCVYSPTIKKSLLN